MMSDRLVIRSNDDDHILFKVFRVRYPRQETRERALYDHHHPELEISCILGGSGVYVCEGHDYPFSAGDIFLHCGNDIHCFREIEPSEQLSMLVFQFEQRLIWAQSDAWFEPKYLQLFTRKSRVGHQIPHTAPEAESIRQLLLECFDECSAEKPAYEMMVKAKLLAILSNLVRYFHNELESPAHQPTARHMEQIEQSMQYILKNLEQPLTLDQLAREAQMSRSYYSTIFKALNGISVWDYITNLRIERAQRLLETTNSSIIEVSESCGYNNISNFNRSFKQVTGKTPRQFRSESINEELPAGPAT